MNVVSCFYKDYLSFKSFLITSNVDARYHSFVKITTTGYSPEQSVQIAKDIRSILPNALIVGVTSHGVSDGEKLLKKAAFVKIFSFKKSRFKALKIDTSDHKPASWVLEIVGEICESNTKLLMSYFASPFSMCDDFVDEFNKILPEVPLFGGNCSSAENELFGFVFDEDGYYLDSLYVVAFSGESLNVYTKIAKNVECIGDAHVITEMHDTVVKTINGLPTKEFYSKEIGIDSEAEPSAEYEAEVNQIMEKFPLVSLDGKESLKFIFYDHKRDVFFSSPGGKLSEGDKVRIGYLSSRTVYSEYFQFFDEFDMLPLECLLVNSCYIRQKMFPELQEQCIKAFSTKNTTYTYLAGEIARHNGMNSTFQGTTCFVGMSEGTENNLPPFHREFLKVDELQDDVSSLDLYNDVLKRQNDSVVAAKEELLKKIYQQEKLANKLLFVEKHTGMFNAERFSYDSLEKNINKICLVVIEKSAQLANYIGQDDYIEYFKLNLGLFTQFLKSRELLDETQGTNFENIRIYVNDLSSFIIAAPKSFDSSKFMELIRGMFFEFNKHYNYKNIVCLNNFFIILDHDEDLLAKAKLMLSEKKNELKRFVIFEDSTQETENFEESLQALAAINYAIEHDGIEPFFQPIYDNSTKATRKFESLMRLKDENGKLWFPNQFLPVAKEFRLYLQLSSEMIKKVFKLFDERNEAVSINLSAIDINSDQITSMIYEKLAQLKNPQNFIFEILESDAFDDLNTLSNFIEQLRKYKVSIAIDDFGSGYSNLIEIVKLRPDIIKIDGEIIKHLLNDEVNRSMIDVIIYMAKTFNVDLVAEYAESQELQDFLAQKGIRYSQGYFFSKPLPYSQIDEYLEKERKNREELMNNSES